MSKSSVVNQCAEKKSRNKCFKFSYLKSIKSVLFTIFICSTWHMVLMLPGQVIYLKPFVDVEISEQFKGEKISELGKGSFKTVFK